jgi:hypothetical protein
LRRAVSSFIVEVRRRPRLATTIKPDAQLSEARSPRAGFDRTSHRVAAAAFEVEKADPSLVEVASSPKGRILPSLVPDESLRRTLRDAAPTPTASDLPSRAPKRPPVRTSKGKDQASQLPRNSRLSSDENAAVAARASTTSHQMASVPSDDGAGISPRDPTRAPRQVVGDAGGLPVSAKATRRKVAISRDDVRAKPLPNGQRSAIGTDSPATPSSVVDDRSPLSRDSPIDQRIARSLVV